MSASNHSNARAALDLTGRVAVITGATSGIGAACAEAFARLGAPQMLSGRDAQRGAKLLERIRSLGAEAEFLAGDIRERAFCDRLIESAVRRFSRLDILVNSAGISLSASALETSDEQWRAIMETNVDGTFFASRAALREMVKRSSGSIINVASDWGLVGGRDAAAYCASKGAVVLLTKAMALDHATEGIRINVVCPGDTHTQMMLDDFEQRGVSVEDGIAESAAGIPMHRMGRPEEIADAICFLASDSASFITGVALPVDGGHTAV